MATPRKMTLNRNYNLASTYGHSIRFNKNVPTHVPPACYAEALAIGAEFVDGEGLPEVVKDDPAIPTDPAARAGEILAAVLKIVERNVNTDFTAANSPKVAAVVRELGYEVTSKEIASAWQKYHDDKAEEANG